MILFSERQALLLQLLSEVDQATIGADLAALLGVSTRTLRYDISRINGVTKVDIIEATPKGYRLSRPLYNDFLARNSRLATQLDHHERILLYLMETPSTDVYDIMRDCYLSESVTRAALQRLRPQVESSQLVLTVKGPAVRLSGPEMCFRKLLGDLVHNAMDVSVGQTEKIDRYFPDISLQEVGALLQNLVAARGLEIDDIRMSNAVVNIAICLQRCRFPIADDTDSRVERVEMNPATEELSSALIDALLEKFPAHAPLPADQDHLRMIIGVALNPHEDCVSHPTERTSISDAVRVCLDETTDHFNLTVTSEKLYDSVSDHMERLALHTRVLPYFRNTLQESLRTRSPFLYDAAVYLADRLAKMLGIAFPDDEIGLLAIYLGLYSGPVAPDDHTITAIVICPRYQTLRDWLLAGLVERFGDRLQILDIVSTKGEADTQDVDLVISTIDEASRVHPCVQVSALLSDLDLSAVDHALLRAAKQKSRSRIAQSVRRFLDPELFFTGVSPKSAKEAIDFLCSALEERGVVPAEFRDSVLLRETYSPTAFARRFAVPHAMDFLAHQTKVAVLIPSAPINWESADASLVLMLAINGDDYEDFIHFYQPLISLLYDPNLYSELRRVTTYEEFMNFLDNELSETE
ncbi:BglG family transcription antiterminator [Acidipropionibacterium thoenii]|uniref:BglG family transcription antiterminator n=1 Tax=Acidipropionibacterium thoenii TaxID=1751 RepID=UPI000489E29C|nr:PTS sugar transporter subunit IIA [Acidipropionibacterium thoenii]